MCGAAPSLPTSDTSNTSNTIEQWLILSYLLATDLRVFAATITSVPMGSIIGQQTHL